MGGTKCLRLGTCELKYMRGVLQRNSRITLRSVLIEVVPSESHELLNSFWVGPSGSGDPHGVQGTRCGGLGR
jgi:hypothetical protein